MESRPASRIPKPLPVGSRRRCGSCVPHPRVSYSTSLSPNRCHPALSKNPVPVEPAPGPVLLGTIQNASHDGTTDASMQWQIPAAVGEQQQHLQGLNSIKVVPPDMDHTLPLTNNVSGDDSAPRLLPCELQNERVTDCDPQSKAFTRSISQPSCLIRLSLRCTLALAS